MARLRLALLNAAYEGEHTTRNFRRELDADLSEFRATDGELPPTFEFDGVVVTGSKASVYWDEPWIDALLSWVGEAVERDLPVLGVCYGHQVLAEVLGGRVAAMDGFEIGYRTVHRTAEDPVFDGIDEEFLVFTTHGDAVVELPPGAERLAENDCSVHAFRLGHAVGVQFHPEYDRETAESVTRGKEFLGEDRVECVLDGITEERYRAACQAKLVFENFCEYVREVRDVDAAPAR